uniref:hypothetical protein n=1 Tax=Nocardioides sp. R-C-SC26 TaxID=2870414 RepID=UPI001E40FF4A
MTDVASSTDNARLRAYLHAHWVGASAGVSTFRRAAKGFPEPGGAATLAALADDVAADRASLRQLMAAVGAAPSPPQTLAAQLVAQGRRFKPDQLLAGAARAAGGGGGEGLRRR